MSAAATPPRARWQVVLLAALTVVLALLLPAVPASATALSAAETRVGAFHPATTVVVGVHECITAGQRPVRGPSQPQVAAGSCVAAEAGVFSRVAATQGARDVGSALPKSFNLTRSAGDEVWVHPNATKHMWEETRGLTFGRDIAEQQRLMGLSGAVDNAVVGRWGEMQVSQGWELIFSAPRSAA